MRLKGKKKVTLHSVNQQGHKPWNHTTLQKDEQKVIFTVSFLIAAEGTDPKASAGVPMAGPDNPNSSCSAQQQTQVGQTQYNHILKMKDINVYLCVSLVCL